MSTLDKKLFIGALEEATKYSLARFNEIDRLITNNPIYLFGFGGKGRALAQHIFKNHNSKISILDTNKQTLERARAEGFQTIEDIKSIDRENACIILGACQDQQQQARIAEKNYIYFQEAAYYFDAPHLENKAREITNYVIENKDALYEIYERIHPDSKDTFFAILKFRITLNPTDLVLHRNKNSEMWFDVFQSKSKIKYHTLLDIGAYDGDTLNSAHERLSVNRGIAVEANNELFHSITEVAKKFSRGILILPHAAWSHNCKLIFTEIRGGMITVSESADGTMSAAPIDEHIDEQIDLIKIDIEGAETKALIGCERLLKEQLPDLAIAAYHRPEDLVEIIELFDKKLRTGEKYEIYIGHYSDCFDDTIIYFIKH